MFLSATHLVAHTTTPVLFLYVARYYNEERNIHYATEGA